MKKALALVLALVLALSMAVSATAALTELKPIELNKVTAASAAKVKIPVIDVEDDLSDVLYTTADTYYYEGKLALGTEYYVSLGNAELTDIKLTANGNITAELVKFDPAKMVLVDENGEDTILTYTVVVNNDKTITEYSLTEAVEAKLLGVKGTYKDFSLTGWNYTDAQTIAGLIRNDKRVKDTVKVVCDQENVNIVKITVANNFTAHYTEGTLKVEAYNKDIKANVAGKFSVVNDVTIFEYEQVKWAAENNKYGAALQLGDLGYSEYDFAGNYGEKYDTEELRENPFALVVSTTAFRAIEGKNLTLNVVTDELAAKVAKALAKLPNVPGEVSGALDVASDLDFEISVTLKEIAAGQKGVNFFAWAEVDGIELDPIPGVEVRDEVPSAISFGFLGDQVIKGKYEITVDLPINYYELRELFGLKVEEEDIISYYVVDENNNVVKTIKVDYMTDDISENVEFTVEGENDTLGWYTLCLEVPAVEAEGEANPNTGAESVVGVVAALAVVSVATAAAVSLKK